MIGHETLEREILDEHEPLWKAQGYEVIMSPRGAHLPNFLGTYQPDAILVGRDPKVIVEVVLKGQPHADRRIRDLKSLISGHDDWRLEVLYRSSEDKNVPVQSVDEITTTISKAEAIARIEPRGAFLLLWAALEAIARRFAPDRSNRPQTPGRVVETLAFEGVIEPSNASWLRDLSRLRNRLIHGDLEVAPTSQELEQMVALTRNLVLEAPK